ncbi:PREDICTED: uncharacterized protein LOC109181224 [Ipomoea nil]|uniref:uncharacterized protein LOC109181224 n=1 Tax=Ipomoea nil TaxID=35883 RepID=UPI000901409D|nr:PREDICTED: uncharacterized protein LOC109181224 [Ipomoea nil]
MALTTAWPLINGQTAPANSVANHTGNAAGSSTLPPSTPVSRLDRHEVVYEPLTQSNPYYLHVNENPSLELVSFPLDGSNYHAWARAMTMALSCKNKVPFINGAIKKPSQDDLEKYYVWERCNNIVCTWLVRSLSPTIGRSVLWIDTAYGIWEDLKRRFSQQDLFRIAEIMCEIYQTKQGDDSLNEYFTKQKLLWDELVILRPPMHCTCSVKCACGKKLDQVNEQAEKDKLSIFLMGLHEKYTGARNQIILMRPLPDVNEAYSMVAQQERQFQIGATGFRNQLCQAGENSNSNGSAFLDKGEGGFQQGYKKAQTPYKKPVCTYCGYTGHTQDKCYKKHGYPPGWKPKSRSQSVNQVQGASVAHQHNSDENVSFNQNDFKKFMEFMQMQKSISNSPLDQSPQASINTVAADLQSEGIASINSVKHGVIDWIVDSGATHHIVSDLILLKNQKKVQNLHVDLLNGQKAAIACTGTVCLSNDFILHDVLYVPGFHYNLISIGSFIRDSKGAIEIHTNQCIIQDAIHGRMIGRAELQNGLYHLVFPIVPTVVCNTASISSKCILWHSRLGHASHAKIQLLKSIEPEIQINKEMACDCCHFSKQK